MGDFCSRRHNCQSFKYFFGRVSVLRGPCNLNIQSVDRSITLAKYIEIWLDQIAPKKLAASTLARDRQDIRRILPALGHYKLTELNKEILRDFYDAMRQVRRESTGEFLAEGTVEGIHSCLCGILSEAVEAGYITHNPAWRAYKKKGISKERPVADEETVQRLIAALETQSLKYEVYYKLILATGMRRGEACGLRWSDIDWRQRALHIRRNVVKLSRQPIMVKEPKTRAGVRVVYLSKDMCKLLRAWEKECQWEKEQRGDDELTQDDYLFQQSNGDPMVPCTFTYRFKMILRENGLPDNLNVHSLRHTNASMLIAQGVDVRTVAGLLGHAQPSTTLDIYSHAFDKNKRLAGQKLSEAMGL